MVIQFFPMAILARECILCGRRICMLMQSVRVQTCYFHRNGDSLNK